MNFNRDKLFLKVVDHSVSKESFDLYHDLKYDVLFTTPQPPIELLSKYYESADYISHTDGRRTLFEYSYHLIKSYSLRSKLKIINSIFPDKGNLLDIGAGTGDFVNIAKKNGWNATGTEPDAGAAEIAKSKELDLAKESSEFGAANFDVITMWHVLEHVPDLEQQLIELKRLLKPNGRIIVAVPNFKSYDAEYYKEFWAAYDVPRHLSHFSKHSITKIFGDAAMDVVKVLPMKFDAFYVSLLSEKYKSGKMNLLNAVIVGMKSNFKARFNMNYSSLMYIIENRNI